MNFYTATQQAIGSIEAGAESDSNPVRAGLQLAVYAWQTCDPQPATATPWAMFGNGVCAAVDELGQPPEPFVVVADLPVPDTAQVRHQTAALTTAVAAHLEAAAGDAQHFCAARGRRQSQARLRRVDLRSSLDPDPSPAYAPHRSGKQGETGHTPLTAGT